MQLRPVSCQSYILWGLETSEFSLSDNWWRGWRHGFCHYPRDLSSGSHVKSLELYHKLKISALRSDRRDWLLKLPSQPASWTDEKLCSESTMESDCWRYLTPTPLVSTCTHTFTYLNLWAQHIHKRERIDWELVSAVAVSSKSMPILCLRTHTLG